MNIGKRLVSMFLITVMLVSCASFAMAERLDDMIAPIVPVEENADKGVAAERISEILKSGSVAYVVTKHKNVRGRAAVDPSVEPMYFSNFRGAGQILACTEYVIRGDERLLKVWYVHPRDRWAICDYIHLEDVADTVYTSEEVQEFANLGGAIKVTSNVDKDATYLFIADLGF